MRSRTVRRALALTALATLAPAASALAQEAPNPLRPGALYAATNEPTGNRILTFSRATTER